MPLIQAMIWAPLTPSPTCLNPNPTLHATLLQVEESRHGDVEAGHIELCQEVHGNASDLEGKETGNLPGVMNSLSTQSQPQAGGRL